MKLLPPPIGVKVWLLAVAPFLWLLGFVAFWSEVKDVYKFWWEELRY